MDGKYKNNNNLTIRFVSNSHKYQIENDITDALIHNLLLKYYSIFEHPNPSF
ncbi:hypothetical protein SAMN05216324_1372 [Chryseobacterium limigenitum]|uniref:Uncharacterized protein n=1 Tax=Chryseobacterium limigenitum TaxID=1612149 RepID=A0A1K2IXA4_9FLAO|nr:hypothetical protein SAMN05216324_1372 [Chryseobacterium limigenitum]